MAVINDRKTVVAQNNGMATVYDPTFLSAGFYYPFGMEMPGLTYSASDYRYGFNSKEKDSAFGLLHYDYGFRIYHPGLGRFLSVDPLARSYPWYTPYQFAGNTPIMAVDLDGLEPITAFPEYLQPLIRGHVIVVTNTSDDVELTIALSRQGIMRNGQYTINPNPLGSSFTMIEYQSFSLQNNGYLSSHAFLGPIIQRIPIPVIPPIATLSPPLLNTSSGVDLNLQDFMLPKPDEPVNEITFRGEPILPDKPFSFSELIATGLYNPAIRNIEEAKDQIRDLAEFLNENKDASVLILGNFHLNKGGTVKPWETTYSEIIKKKEGIPEHINTFEEFAVERAKNVERLLINEFGVDPKQLRIGTGNQYKDAQRGQSVSFELKRKKK